MILDFDNIEEKRLELEIIEIDKELNELEGLKLLLKEMYLKLKISLMEEGFTKEDFDSLVKDFNENPKSKDELIAIEESFFSESDEEGKLNYCCNMDSENFNVYVMSVFGRYLKGTEIILEDISELRDKKLKLQKELLDSKEYKRKYKEVVLDEE